MEITKESTVGNIVSQNIKTAHVFKKFGIDFCCGGGISIEKACNKNGVSFDDLQSQLQDVEQVTEHVSDYNNWDLDILIDMIVKVHHSYVSESLPILVSYANKVASVHGESATELLEINSLVIEVANELNSHMQKEEQVLFPYIKHMVAAQKAKNQPDAPHFGTVNNPILMMEHEHENAGNVFKRIDELTNNYTPPKWACNTFKALYALLEEFEQDLHQHIHLENNILHPKAIALEQSL